MNSATCLQRILVRSHEICTYQARINQIKYYPRIDTSKSKVEDIYNEINKALNFLENPHYSHIMFRNEKN